MKPESCAKCDYVYREQYPIPQWGRGIFCIHPEFTPAKYLDLKNQKTPRAEFCPYDNELQQQAGEP
jgi:hypothetical protein